MRHLVILNRICPPMHGATGRMAADLADRLHANGWIVHRLHGFAGYHSLTYMINNLYLVWQALWMPQKAVFVIMTDPPFLVWAAPLLKLLKRGPVLHWCQDMYPDLLPVLGYRLWPGIMPVLRQMTRWALSFCDHVVVIGACMEARIKAYGVPDMNITQIENWAPLSLQPIPAIDDGVVTVLYAGNFGHAHVFDSLIKAATLMQDDDRLRFILSGSGKTKNALLQKITKRGLKNITFHDFIAADELPDLLARGDVHVTTMATGAAGFLVPCKIYSGVAVGRASLFIGPPRSAAADFLRRHACGFVVEPDDVLGLVAALRRYMGASYDLQEQQKNAALAAAEINENHPLLQWQRLLNRYGAG